EKEKLEKEQSVVQIIEEEERAKGSVAANVYKSYWKSIGGWYYPVMFLLSFLVLLGSQIALQIFLATSSSASSTSPSFIPTYSLLAVVLAIAYFSWFGHGAFMTWTAGKAMHNAALAGVLGSTMSWIESQPIGRLINRFSTDMYSVDLEMTNVVINLSGSVLAIITGFILIAQGDPWLLLILAFVSLVFYFMYRYWQKSNIELKRMAAILKSPLDSHVSESITGSATIRAYNLSAQFVEKERQLLDSLNAAQYSKKFLEIWLKLRIGMMVALMSVGISLLALSLPSSQAANIGLSLTASITLAGTVFRVLANLGQGESELNAVERLAHYGNHLPQEAARVLPSDPSADVWPSSGAIEFEHVQICYPSRPSHAVIKDLSVQIRGSGKSTLITALFRMIETSRGRVTIDGVDISQLGLKTLRSAIQMIPQDPVLFEGTFRTNLDPEGRFEDEALWNAIAIVGLDGYVRDQPGKLDAAVSQKGENLSVGQRQLMCLSRAILAKPKILIMDEATAAVDGEADQLIQTALKTRFDRTTVLSIAHRLQTIAGFDR
ncbi:hypothetical protein HDU91_002056, partial [Kappamyces sp. JEL0680]